MSMTTTPTPTSAAPATVTVTAASTALDDRLDGLAGPRRSRRARGARRLTTALLAGGLVLGAAACGSDGGDDSSAPADAEQAVEDLVEQETGQGVDIDTDDGTVETETEDGVTGEIDVDVDTEGGELGTLPEGFPDDIDIEGFTIVSGGKNESGGEVISMMAAFSSDDDIDTVIRELGDRMDGWVVKGSSFLSMESPRSQAVRYTKDGRLAAFTVTEKGSGTTILLNLAQE